MLITNNVWISIIVPVYNVEKYINECLDSILSQTHKDFELILVDDGSTDKSSIICDEYALKDKRIRVYHQENQGQAAARNFGVSQAQSDWIVFIDSDDIVHPKLIECLLNAVISTDAKISACPRIQGESLPEGFYQDVDTNFELITITENSLAGLYKTSDYYWALFPSMVHKSILINRPFTPGKIFEDNAVCFKWLLDSGSFCSIDVPLYFYRTTPNSTMNKDFRLKSLDYLWAMNEQIVYYDSIHYDKMLNLVFHDYFYTALSDSKRVKEELKNDDVSRKILIELKNNYEKYRIKLDKRDEYKRRLKKELHPVLFRIEKAIRNKLK